MTKPKTSYLFGKVENGKLIHEDLPKLTHHIRRLDGKEVRILIEKKPKQRKQRSDQQNAYLWAEPLAVLADHTGHTPEEMHDSMKAMFLSVNVEINGNTFNVVKSTTGLNTAEFEEYLSNIRMWAARDLGCYIRLPNEIGISFILDG